VTDENRKRNVADELVRAEQAFQAARALLGLGLHADAVSRAYYGAFHALCALLFSRGLEAKTHASAIHLFNTEFVRASLMESSHNRLLAGIQRARELADYDAAVAFSKEDAEGCLRDAEAFAGDAIALLRRENWVV
jgi:uncharacterized protein (UPF0332 family)